MSHITHEIGAAAANSASAPIRQIWAQAIFGIGVGLTVAWVCFLGYGLVAVASW
jgi:hypothetical protein